MGDNKKSQKKSASVSAKKTTHNKNSQKQKKKAAVALVSKNKKAHTKKKIQGKKKNQNNKNIQKKKKAPVMADKTMGKPNARCKGAPLKIAGKKGFWGNWGNLGKGSAEDCKEACLEEDTCNFAVFQVHNGHCSAFAHCNKPKIGKYKGGPNKGKVKPFVVFEKVD